MDEVQIRVEILIAPLCAFPTRVELPPSLNGSQMGKTAEDTSPQPLGLKVTVSSCLIASLSQLCCCELWLKVTGAEAVMLCQMLYASAAWCTVSPCHGAVVPVCALADFLIMPHHGSL